MVFLSCWSEATFAQSSDEYTLKAALSYNFAKYTQWPESVTGDNIQMCFFNAALQSSFSPLEGKTIGQKTLSIKYVQEIADSDTCNVIFLDRSKRNLLGILNANLADRPVLTISDINGFIDDGGMIEIKTVDNKLRFKINLHQVQLAGVNLGSQLLNLSMELRR